MTDFYKLSLFLIIDQFGERFENQEPIKTSDCVSAAEEFLSYSFHHCHRSSQKNKRMILIYLLPVKMLLVRTPATFKNPTETSVDPSVTASCCWCFRATCRLTSS